MSLMSNQPGQAPSSETKAARTARLANAFLLKASACGDLQGATVAMHYGANPDACDNYGQRPLLSAAQRGDHAMVSLLLKSGADPRVVGADGLYPMASAALLGSIDMMDALGAHCWDAEPAAYHLRSALEQALVVGHLESARHLIRHGADLEARGRSGETLLMRMAAVGQTEAVQLLLSEGACWFAVDEAGLTAVDHAHRAGNARTKAKLKEHALREPVAEVRQPYPRSALARPQALEGELATYTGALSMLQWHLRVLRGDLHHSYQQWLERRHWQSSPHNARWLRTRRLIGALEAGNLHRAWIEFREAPVIVGAHNAAGAPLAVLVVRALNLPDSSSEGDRVLVRDDVVEHGVLQWVMDMVVDRGMDKNVSSGVRKPGEAAPVGGGAYEGDVLFEQVSEEQRRVAVAALLLKALLAAGANENARDALTGDTVAHALIQTPWVRLLLRLWDENLYRNTLNQSNHRLERPLHVATRRRDLVAIQGLLARGCDRNPVNRDGHTPMHQCAYSTDAEVAAILASAGASLKLRTRRGQSIDDILLSSKQRHNGFVALLRARSGIDKAMNIFTPNNPLAAAVRQRQDKGNKS